MLKKDINPAKSASAAHAARAESGRSLRSTQMAVMRDFAAVRRRAALEARSNDRSKDLTDKHRGPHQDGQGIGGKDQEGPRRDLAPRAVLFPVGIDRSGCADTALVRRGPNH